MLYLLCDRKLQHTDYRFAYSTYDSRVVIYDRRATIRLDTVINITKLFVRIHGGVS